MDLWYGLVAEIALKEGELLLSVGEQMLVKVTLLSKAMLTSSHQAYEWLLFRMWAKVIEEIMPLAEDSVAAWLVLAKERLCPALALYLEVLDISEGPDRWNGNGLLQGCHVNIIAIFNH